MKLLTPLFVSLFLFSGAFVANEHSARAEDGGDVVVDSQVDQNAASGFDLSDIDGMDAASSIARRAPRRCVNSSNCSGRTHCHKSSLRAPSGVCR